VRKEGEKRDEERGKGREKYAYFTYIGRETKFITKPFKHTNVKISCRNNNTVE
jgi:hypothetical protein